jgi:hypothetical protein
MFSLILAVVFGILAYFSPPEQAVRWLFWSIVNVIVGVLFLHYTR